MQELSSNQRAWAEVSTAAIEANAACLCRHLKEGTALMAVVKADGYGHGAETVSRAALRGGAKSLGVATLLEGIELRNAGITAPLLILGNLIEADDLKRCLEMNVMPTISSIREAHLCNQLAKGSSRNFQVQLKLDTGMTRLGSAWEDGPKLISAIHKLNNLKLAGIYSHLACADDRNEHFTRVQKQRFDEVISDLPLHSHNFCCHLANSAGTLLDKSLHYDMVRVGIALYGHSPAEHLSEILPLKPALTVRARVTFVRQVNSGVGVSYGHKYITKKPCRLAVINIGYADGIMRSLSGHIYALYNGKALPQVGIITMDQLILDISEAPEIKIGSIVTLLGKDGDQEISPWDWSKSCDSIPWEILCGFKRRLIRIEV